MTPARLLFTAAMLVACYACSGRRPVGSDELLTVKRFDAEFYQWTVTDSPDALLRLKHDCPLMLETLAKSLFKSGTEETLINYYSEPSLHGLYKDAIRLWANDSASFKSFRKEMSNGLRRMQELSLTEVIPALYLHVSGLRENVLVADSLLSCSIDKYLGADFPLYADYFPPYRRNLMTPERAAPDCLLAWLRSEYPFKGNEYVLAERLLYEGKMLFALANVGGYNLQRLLSLSDADYRWCIEYEPALWTFINERNHLYMPDLITTDRYFQPSPATFITRDAPGNIGLFIGFRIVEQYAHNMGVSCADLMKSTDFHDVLNKSKYKPE